MATLTFKQKRRDCYLSRRFSVFGCFYLISVMLLKLLAPSVSGYPLRVHQDRYRSYP